jgi:Protein of unknown function (DUF1064)
MTEVMSRQAFRETLAKAARPSKFQNKRIIVDGVRFASQKEAQRWAELRLLERKGEITGLKRQVRFPLSVNGIKVTTYVSDFTYRDPGGRLVVEDAKGVRTPLYKLKRTWMLVEHGIEIQEV